MAQLSNFPPSDEAPEYLVEGRYYSEADREQLHEMAELYRERILFLRQERATERQQNAHHSKRFGSLKSNGQMDKRPYRPDLPRVFHFNTPAARMAGQALVNIRYGWLRQNGRRYAIPR